LWGDPFVAQMEDWVGGVNGTPGGWRDRHILTDRSGDGSASLSVQGKQARGANARKWNSHRPSDSKHLGTVGHLAFQRDRAHADPGPPETGR